LLIKGFQFLACYPDKEARAGVGTLLAAGAVSKVSRGTGAAAPQHWYIQIGFVTVLYNKFILVKSALIFNRNTTHKI
jgi:hypothetical protein